MRNSHWMGIGCLLGFSLGSTAQAVAQHRVFHSEIEGVPLVKTEGGPKFRGPLFEVDEDLTLGIDEGEPAWQRFTGTPSILVAPNGKMVLADLERPAIYILTSRGELIGRVGRSGRGRGEFLRPEMVMWAIRGESFLVNDLALNRATRFSMRGDLIDTEDYEPVMGDEVMRFISLGDDRYLASRISEREAGRTGDPVDQVVQYWFLNSRLEADGRRVELTARTHFSISGSAFGQIPFTRDPELIPFPDGRLLLSDPENGRLSVLSSEAEPIMHLGKDWERRDLSPEEIRQGRRPYAESDREYLRRVADRIPFPSRHTAFSTTVPDDRGRIWVEHVDPPRLSESATHVRYDVFGADGVWLGVQEFDFRPCLISGDHVYSLSGEEGRGPRLRRYSLRPLFSEVGGGSREARAGEH